MKMQENHLEEDGLELCGWKPLNISTVQPSASIKAPLSTFWSIIQWWTPGNVMEGLSYRIMVGSLLMEAQSISDLPIMPSQS